MNQSRALGVLLCAMASACGGQASEDTALGSLEEPIVRGQETDAFPQVVLLTVRHQASFSRCSGSYIAPRVVLTAAHCLNASGDVPQLSYVYFGTAEAPPFGVQPEIPPPGEPSDFAGVESFLTHPDYDPAVNYPDLAIVYLDRDLPFAPLPLLTERIGRRSTGDKVTMVGWGGSRALVADISVVEGGGIKRRGQATIVGTPTEADFHADDPNPGMLDPAIRADSLKVDGHAPHSNTCAGDSGGPLLIKQGGRTFVAGVSYWTGLFCEDYSIYARIDPFLGFFKDAQRGAGKKAVLPRLECVDRADNGTYTAFFGYENQNGIALDIPRSRRRNSLPEDELNARPEHFAPGDSPWAFSVDFQKKERLHYRLTSPAGQTRVVTADRNSPRCDCAAACEAALSADCSEGNFTRADCVAGCPESGQFFPGCQDELNAYYRCQAALTPAADNWVCDPTFIPQPVLCQDEFFAALDCGGYL